MTIKLRNIIEAACENAELQPSTANKHSVYHIANKKQAKLAFDLLIAYGFEVKLYHEQDYDKLYVTYPKPSAVSNNATMKEMLAYAKALKTLKQYADNVSVDPDIGSPEYSISFNNTPSQDKQCIISFAPSIDNAQIKPDMQYQASKTISPSTVSNKRTKKGEAQDDIFSGPEIMRPSGVRKATSMKSEGPDTVWKQFKLYAKGNSLSAGLTLGACFVGLILFISLFMVSKAFLCPDFASIRDKNPPWYCDIKNAKK